MCEVESNEANRCALLHSRTILQLSRLEGGEIVSVQLYRDERFIECTANVALKTIKYLWRYYVEKLMSDLRYY